MCVESDALKPVTGPAQQQSVGWSPCCIGDEGCENDVSLTQNHRDEFVTQSRFDKVLGEKRRFSSVRSAPVSGLERRQSTRPHKAVWKRRKEAEEVRIQCLYEWRGFYPFTYPAPTTGNPHRIQHLAQAFVQRMHSARTVERHLEAFEAFEAWSNC